MFGTQDANPNGRYPSNVVGYLDEGRLKFFYAPRVTVRRRATITIIRRQSRSI